MSALSVEAARARARAASAQLRGDRQRHRAVEGGDRAAVPAVQAGERGHRAPLRRRGARACVRAAARRRRWAAISRSKSRAGQGSTFTFSVMLAEAPTGAPSAGASADGKRAAGTRSAARAVRGGQSLCARRAQHDPDRARPSRRFRRHRRGRRRGGGTRRLRSRADGRDACRAWTALRRRARSARCAGGAARVPIIGISGRTDARDEEAALAAGMNAFLAKPVSPAALAQAVAKVREVTKPLLRSRSCPRCARCRP